MSNVGRPRVGMKPCVHCKSTKRDSNGQCACRNKAYRLARKNAAKSSVPLPGKPTPAQVEKKVKAAVKKAVAKVLDKPALVAGKYTLVLADGTTTGLARKDAAVKNGEKSKQAWKVYAPSGAVVADSTGL